MPRQPAGLIGDLQDLGIAASGDQDCITLDRSAAERLIARLRDLHAKEADLQRFEDRGHL